MTRVGQGCLFGFRDARDALADHGSLPLWAIPSQQLRSLKESRVVFPVDFLP
jgi:hypothetical protein